MSEFQKYTPDNSPYGTMHDGELELPDYFKAATEKQITENIALFIKEHNKVMTESDIKEYQVYFMHRAVELYAEWIQKHGDVFTNMNSFAEDSYLQNVAEHMQKELLIMRDIGRIPKMTKHSAYN